MSVPSSRSLRPLLTVLVVILVFAALKATKPVTMPLAFALFAVILFWPVYRWLRDRVASGVALAITLVAFLAVIGGFFWAVAEATDEVVEDAHRYEERVTQLVTQAESLFGTVTGAVSNGSEQSNEFSLSSERVASVAQRVAASVWSVLGYLVLITALFTLGIVEVPRWKHKLQTRFADRVSSETIETATQVTTQVQRFLLVQSFTSVLTGVLTGAFCWALGVDFAFVWGILALVLNFIPTLGSIVAVVPPVLFALLQYGLGWQPPVVFVGLAAIQLVLGSYIDPKLQGRYLELSAFVVLLSIVFWGWLWGIPGAFIAVPITASLVLVAKHAGAEWVTRLLTRDERPISSESA